MNRKHVLAGLISILVLTPLYGFGCGRDKSREDAGDVSSARCRSATSAGCVDKSDPRVTAFNNHFQNFEAKCDGFGHVIITTSDQKGNKFVIYPDSQCAGYDPNEVKPVVNAASR